MMKLPSKPQYLLSFLAVVLLLSVVKRLTSSADDLRSTTAIGSGMSADADFSSSSSAASHSHRAHRILGVANYQTAFPDSQSVQIVAAARWGVQPVRNRTDAEHRKQELVYVGLNPYYHVDPLHSSIPYLVPRAAVLLSDIGQAFCDSLYAKGLPMNQLIVTSVLRSVDDVERLRRHNTNATQQSCHLYGTTFDICYNRYHSLSRPVRNDTLKYVLSEVLRDFRRDRRCFVKYEVKQGCFHLTVR